MRDDEELQREIAELEAEQLANRAADENASTDAPSATSAGPERTREQQASAVGDAPPPRTLDGPLRFAPDLGPLPDTPEELLAIINSPKSLAQAQAAMEKIGAIYKRDVVEDMSFQSAEEFNPLVTTLGIGSNPATISAFALHVIPLRKSLGRQFGTTSPAILMLIDLAALSFWRCIQSEHSIVAHLAVVLEKPQFIQRVKDLEKIKDLATKQLVRLLDALRAATGRSLQMDPDADAARILRFHRLSATDARGKRLRARSAA